MKKRIVILTALMLTLCAVSMKGMPAGKVKAAGAVVDSADWNKKTVTITIPNDYTKYKETSQYTLDSVGVWQWGAKTHDGRYTVYFDASDIKKVCDLYENTLKVPQRYAENCNLHDKTVEALK